MAAVEQGARKPAVIRVAALAAAWALAFAPGARAADPDGSQACTTPATRTADDIAGCLHGVGEAAEARLNETYRKALAALDAPSATLLRQAQRDWVAFREAEVKAHDGPWRAGRGTAKRIEASTAIIAAINERERELRLYLPD